MIRILYFAWVREAFGRDEEQMELPAEADTVGALLDWLAARDPAHGAALADRARIRVAVDQVMARPDTPLAGAGEVAIFPPVTGG
jgi:molybdopterin synthase sulfur carrier subunit